MSQMGRSDTSAKSPTAVPTFLNAANPDQVKRNVLAGFRDVLLLPVTIVPRTVTFGVNAIVTGSTQAVSGLSMLNPQRWAGTNGRGQLVKQEDAKSEVIFDTPMINEKEEVDTPSTLHLPGESAIVVKRPASTRAMTPMPDAKSFDSLQLLISLDTALELIHANRDSLKRAETFAKYPGKYGHRVREAIEEIFILMLKAAGDRHIAPGFKV